MTTPTEAQALQDLKKPVPAYGHYTDQNEYDRIIGWNACIDHLAATNRLNLSPDLTHPENVLKKSDIVNMTDADRAAALAKRFHGTYERLAPSHGYETRKESAKPWSDVPDQNKNLMIAVCAEILNGR